MIHSLAATGLTLALMSGCATAGTHVPDLNPGPPGPTISSVTPISGLVGAAYPIEIIVTGQGFAPTGNVVRFGPIRVGEVASSHGGTRIAFLAPKQQRPTGDAPPMELLPGKYPITITTAGITSDPVEFELVRGEAGIDQNR